MTIRHHIGDDTLMAYSNGTLAESLSVVVATHLAICPKCRRSLAMMEDMAGLLLMEAEPMELARTERELADVIEDGAGNKILRESGHDHGHKTAERGADEQSPLYFEGCQKAVYVAQINLRVIVFVIGIAVRLSAPAIVKRIYLAIF